MNQQYLIDVQAFRDFCAGQPPEKVIDHETLYDCAIGQYADSIRLAALRVAADLKEPMVNVCGTGFWNDIGSKMYAPLEFPTFGVLSLKLTKAIDTYKSDEAYKG